MEDAECFERLGRIRLIPVVTIDDASSAEPLAAALVRGGVPCAEVTLRTAAAAGAIRSMARHGELLIGAGTVLTVEQVKTAVEAGAHFVVSPGLHESVVDYCGEQNIPIVPGVATASEIAGAHDRGLRVVKFFPADVLGGVRALRALGAAYPMMRFVPTGGVNADNVIEYLRLPQVLACGGSWLASPKLYASGDFGAVERVVRAAVEGAQKEDDRGQV